MVKEVDMTSEVTLVFPHQLLKNHPALNKRRRVFIIEDHLFFTQYNFHKKKIILHRASMKYYEDYLKMKGYKVTYVEAQEHKTLQGFIKSNLSWEGIKKIHYVDTVDFLLEKNLREGTDQHQVKREIYDPPQFMLNNPKLKDTFLGKRNQYLMASFYQKQRKHFDILMDGNQPQGGKWSFDTENRKKMPSNHQPSAPHFTPENTYVKKAKQYVAKHCPDNYGDADQFIYPITFAEAENLLDHFLEHRMYSFGKYQDAIHPKENFMYHSLISSSLNIGLLTPEYVLQKTLDKNEELNFPINSLEGFIRQILGWREFMRLIYEKEGVFIRTHNFFKFKKVVPEKILLGKTGIPPIDDCINRNKHTSYNHHIERLMLLGNFMLLCEIHPDAVYQFFMERYIDAYDWVMVPNVYSMSQYADGGLITTKPYISGSNYVLKMSHYPRGEWCEIWDALFWRFIFKQKNKIGNNPRMSFMYATLKKMKPEKLDQHLRLGNDYLTNLTESFGYA